jgi:hypothetical protein
MMLALLWKVRGASGPLCIHADGKAKTAVALPNLAKMEIGCVWAPLEIPASWPAIIPTLP